jgi:hypothetical protein
LSLTCRFVQTSRQEKDGTWSELTWFETTVLTPLSLRID